MPRGKKNIEEIMEKKESEMNSELEKRKAERKRHMDLVRNIDDDLSILVYCNAGNTTVIYDCPRTKNHYEMKYGDFDYMTYMELKVMKSIHPGMLTNYLIIPIDVNSEEYTIEDVLKILKIEDLYEEEMLIEGNIDYILNEVKPTLFKKIMEDNKDKNKEYTKLVIDRAIELAKKGKFTDYSKMSLLEDIYGDKEHNLFKDAIDTYKEFN